jgi:two-component system LytT family response regulator
MRALIVDDEPHALDYLLKPFDQERFDAALDQARKQLVDRQSGSVNERILALVAENAARARNT